MDPRIDGRCLFSSDSGNSYEDNRSCCPLKALLERIENRASSQAILARIDAKKVVWCWSHQAQTTNGLSGKELGQIASKTRLFCSSTSEIHGMDRSQTTKRITIDDTGSRARRPCQSPHRGRGEVGSRETRREGGDSGAGTATRNWADDDTASSL
jgi:hypothetical protein